MAVRRAVFCMVCSFSMLVLETMGNQIVLAYSSIGLVIALYVVVRVSFCFPYEVEVRALMMLFLLFAVSDIVFRCLLTFSSGSNVSPRIFRFLTVGMILSLILRSSVWLFSDESSEKIVAVDLRGLSVRLFSTVQL